MLEYITAPVRFIDGAGHHVRKFSPSKRLKAAHRIVSDKVSLKAYARAMAKPKKERGIAMVPMSVTAEAATAWLKNKDR